MRAWAIGIFFDGVDPVWANFRDQHIACQGWDAVQHPDFVQRMNVIAVGDLIVARSTYQFTWMYVRGVGLCNRRAEPNQDFGQCIGVEWLVASPDGQSLNTFEFGINECIVELPYQTIAEVLAWVRQFSPDAYRQIFAQQVSQMKELLLHARQIILTGPPGTSKTYEAKRLCASLLDLCTQAAVDRSDMDAIRFWDLQGLRWNMVHVSSHLQL
ncbi:hypothetical protein [uncultured Thiodictyon sp.]|uniref:hypothetical protein n=1 Tax=uncultured Thiodictyon sp. TaxID=1846217 RepID=UPI0025FEE351|nr:hypothetical protein [uncultured Thiodictyon sp.]